MNRRQIIFTAIVMTMFMALIMIAAIQAYLAGNVLLCIAMMALFHLVPGPRDIEKAYRRRRAGRARTKAHLDQLREDMNRRGIY